jgi:hypothetical protein
MADIHRRVRRKGKQRDDTAAGSSSKLDVLAAAMAVQTQAIVPKSFFFLVVFRLLRSIFSYQTRNR